MLENSHVLLTITITPSHISHYGYIYQDNTNTIFHSKKTKNQKENYNTNIYYYNYLCFVYC